MIEVTEQWRSFSSTVIRAVTSINHAVAWHYHQKDSKGKNDSFKLLHTHGFSQDNELRALMCLHECRYLHILNTIQILTLQRICYILIIFHSTLVFRNNGLRNYYMWKVPIIAPILMTSLHCKEIDPTPIHIMLLILVFLERECSTEVSFTL